MRTSEYLITNTAVGTYCSLFSLLDDLDEDLLVELDDVVRENQRTCLPFAKSGRAELQLLEKYPELLELMARGRRAKIDSMALQSRLHEDESRFAHSVKAKVGSFDDSASSPSIEKANRKSAKMARLTSASPVLRARTSHVDLMFDMDDENDHNITGPTDPAASRSASHGEFHALVSFRDPVRPSETSEPSLRSGTKGNIIKSESTASLSPSSTPQPERTSIVDPIDDQEAAIPGLGLGGRAPISSKPWGPSALSSSKLGMRDIMAQAASGQLSNISLGLSQTSNEGKVAGPSTGRLSQRERKKQQQQQQEVQSAALSSPSTPTTTIGRSAPKSPWQGASTGPKVSLKDVLGNEQESHANQPSPITRSSSIPPLTLQQTVPGGASSTKKAPLNNSQSTSPNPRKPAHASQKPSSPAQPRSFPRPQSQPQPSNTTSTSTPILSPPLTTPIRHNNSPIPAEPSLQLSMADILSQQQTEKDIIKEAVAKRSLQEIQQEQEFQEWWDQESRKVRLEEEEAAATMKGAEGGDARGVGGGARAARGKGRGGGRARGRERGK